MNIYFSCSITGGRADQQAYLAIVHALLKDGHEVPTAILASEDVTAFETIIEPREVFLRDTAWVEGCDALVAEVSTPSHGVGYEICLALNLGKPVLCCYQAGRQVSKMILGNNHPLIQMVEYVDIAQAATRVREFIQSLSI